MEHLAEELWINSTSTADRDRFSTTLRNPGRIMRVRSELLDYLIDVEVEARTKDRLATMSKLLAGMPPEAEILGPSFNPNWLNGNALKRARISAGLTQKALAKMVGLAQPQLSDLERMGFAPVTSGHEDLVERLVGVLGPVGLTAEMLRTRYSRQSVG
jgi:hypothetical protein